MRLTFKLFPETSFFLNFPIASLANAQFLIAPDLFYPVYGNIFTIPSLLNTFTTRKVSVRLSPGLSFTRKKYPFFADG